MATIDLALNSQEDLELIISAIRREKELLEWEIKKIENKIKKYEQEYHMSSEEFNQKYSSGELGDAEDFMIWAGEYDFLQQFYSKKERLTDLIKECQKHIVQ